MAAKAAEKPKLTNRGSAGLLGKVTGTIVTAPVVSDGKAPTSGEPLWTSSAKDKVAPALKQFIVDISTLTPDPVNARLHPDRNLASIKDSLCLYGQVKPVVVRKSTRVVVAGNGTMESAKSLGWTKIAATFVDMDDAAAAGYGLADNRTAELARWDFEVVARLDKMLQEVGVNPVGWSQDELDVLRMADWTPPSVSDVPFGSEGAKSDKLVLGFSPDDYEIIKKGTDLIRGREGRTEEEMPIELSLRLIVAEWVNLFESEDTSAEGSSTGE